MDFPCKCTYLSAADHVFSPVKLQNVPALMEKDRLEAARKPLDQRGITTSGGANGEKLEEENFNLISNIFAT